MKIGEECAEDMHKGQCGYQIASYIPPPSPPRYSLCLKEIVQLYMYYTQNFRQNFLCPETINMTSTIQVCSVPRLQLQSYTQRKGVESESKGTRLYTVSLAKVPTVECKIQCTLSIPAVNMYLTCDTQEFFSPTHTRTDTFV